MSEATSSCRPAKLVSFASTLVGVAEGLPTRISALRFAVEAYHAGCDPAYTVPLSGTPVELGGWGIDQHDLGDWTREIGARFLQADAVDAYTGDRTAIVTLPDSVVVAGLSGRFARNPYLGETASGTIDWSHVNIVDQWLADLDQGSNVASDGGDFVQTASTTWSRFLTGEGLSYQPLHAAPSGIATGVRAFSDLSSWVGSGLSFAAGFLSQYDKDAGLAPGTQIGSALVAGTVDAGAFSVGFAIGTGVAAETGPFAPLVGLAAGLGADVLANLGLDHILPGAPSTKQLVASPQPTDQALSSVQLDADNQAANDAQGNPALEAQIQRDTGGQIQNLRYLSGEQGPPTAVPPSSPSPP